MNTPDCTLLGDDRRFCSILHSRFSSISLSFTTHRQSLLQQEDAAISGTEKINVNWEHEDQEERSELIGELERALKRV